MLYRQEIDSAVWHFAPQCKTWPENNVQSQHTLDGEVCSECIAIQALGLKTCPVIVNGKSCGLDLMLHPDGTYSCALGHRMRVDTQFQTEPLASAAFLPRVFFSDAPSFFPLIRTSPVFLAALHSIRPAHILKPSDGPCLSISTFGASMWFSFRHALNAVKSKPPLSVRNSFCSASASQSLELRPSPSFL
jgi:hypothetical protein